MKYQWRFNGTDLPGATSATLILPLAEQRHAGTYQAEVRNAGGTVLSQPVQLVVVAPSWVTTLAGSGVAAFKDGAGADAGFSSPADCFVAPDGSILVADTSNHRIRKISPAGEVTTVAGTGAAGFADGPAASAQFNSPSGVLGSPSGDVFVADTGNHRVRKISAGPSPGVSTVAGSGVAGFQEGLGTSARFNAPTGIAADAAGNLYVADSANHAIRKITSNGEVSTLAGNGVAGYADGAGRSARFNRPLGLALALDGTLFIADSLNHRIRKIAQDGAVSTIAGNGEAGFINGPAGAARFSSPTGITADAEGNLWVTELGNHAVRRISRDRNVTTSAGTGAAGFAESSGMSAQFNNPGGVGTDSSGNLVVVDTGNHRIRLITLGRPQLQVTRAGTDLVFAWPASATDFALESADELAAPTMWAKVSVAAAITGGTNTVQLPISSQQKFYRLRTP